MKSQERRDEEALTIFGGLLLFVLVTAVGSVALVLAHRFMALSGGVLTTLVYAVLGCAAVSSIHYVYRHRGR